MSSEPISAEPKTDEVMVAVQNVSKRYEIYAHPSDRLKQAIFMGRRKFHTDFWALRDISFEVRRGEALGIIGRNGSGKSTLLQIIAGTLRPTKGEAQINGRVAALLELGSGFNYEFTGRENVFINGAILGLTQREIEERYDDIASFADIGAYIDQPVKTYSTGMVMRLAFAVQVQVRPDILIVDEALAVGDQLFQKRCYQKMEELRSSGVTLLFVSHDMESIRTLTTHAILLNEGRIRSRGSPAEVLLDYRRLLHDAEKKYYDTQFATATAKAARDKTAPPPQPSPAGGAASRTDFGDMEAEIVGVTIMDGKGEPCAMFYPGDTMLIRIVARMNRDLTRLNIGLRIRNKEGIKIYSWGTFNQDVNIWNGRAKGAVFWENSFQAGDTVAVDFECECRLGMNLYEVQAVVCEEAMQTYGAQRILHWKDEAAFFQVMVSQKDYFFGGVTDMQMKAHISD
jgi:lipopolysaccharide transport system ATP-binding protein